MHFLYVASMLYLIFWTWYILRTVPIGLPPYSGGQYNDDYDQELAAYKKKRDWEKEKEKKRSKKKQSSSSESNTESDDSSHKKRKMKKSAKKQKRKSKKVEDEIESKLYILLNSFS